MYGVTQRLEAWRRWQAAAGPWVGWSICLPLVAPTPHVATILPPQRLDHNADALVATFAEGLTQGKTAILLDLEPTLGVEVAARLFQQQLSYVVLILPRWPHAEAILPSTQLEYTLVLESRRLDPPCVELKNVAFVLDAERQKRVDRPADDPRIDNRYHVSIADLPKLVDLRRAGIRRVVKMSHA